MSSVKNSKILESLPLIVEIEPTEGCNLRCRGCHVSFQKTPGQNFFNIDLLKKLERLNGAYFILGSIYEPTLHPRFGEILDFIKSIDATLELITNATLLQDTVLDRLKRLRIAFLTVSFDGIYKETYEHVRRRADYGHTLERIRALRNAVEDEETYFLLNYTMMRSTLAEVEDAPGFWEREGFDSVNFINMVVRDLDTDVLKQSLWPIRNDVASRLDAAAEDIIRNNRQISIRSPWFQRSSLRHRYPDNVRGISVFSGHPQARPAVIPRAMMQQGPGPGMAHPCKSAFSMVRILASGELQLCYKFNIGNLNEQSFEDIWFGEKATRIRQKLVASDDACRACDYYRFAINEDHSDVEDEAMYFSEHLVPYRDSVNFDTGTAFQRPPVQPRLIESIGSMNIVEYGPVYYAIPQTLGPLDLTRQSVGALPGVLQENTLGRLRAAVRAAARDQSESRDRHPA